MKTYLFHGPSGCGKDTQVDKLMLEYDIERIATGEMFRKMYEMGDSDALEAQKYWSVGKFVEDELTYKMLNRWMERFNDEKNWIFVSVVRAQPQIAKFDEILGNYDRKLDGFIHFTLSEEAAIERMSLRTTCNECQSAYHSKYKPEKIAGICDKCGGKLTQRDDDKPEKIKSRLTEYNRTIQPLLDEYRSRGILFEIDASPSIEQIYENLKKIVTF